MLRTLQGQYLAGSLSRPLKFFLRSQNFQPPRRSLFLMHKRVIAKALRPVVLFLVAITASVAQEPQKPVQPVPITGQPPATILIIRHAEKLTDGRIDLSPTGFKRADLLTNLFVPAGVRSDLPTPQVLIASHQSPHSNRPVQTITPLAKALNLPIDSTYMSEDYASVARSLLSGKYAGKVVLIAWHHGVLPQFVTALGAQPPYAKWPDTQFDRIWRIDYDKDGKATLKDLPHNLLPGDSN